MTQKAGAHPRHEIVGRRRVHDIGRPEVDGLPGHDLLAGALALQRVVDAMVAEDPHQKVHVGQARNVLEGQRLVGQEARDHQRQGRVLGARNPDGPVERSSADHANAIHVSSPRDAADAANGGMCA